MDPRLAQELELLGEIYSDELEIKPGQSSVKLKFHCLPLLEDQNIDHHYEYDHPYLTAIFDVPNEYPALPPKFSLESSHSKVSIGSQLADMTERLTAIIKTMGTMVTILDLVESIRMWMYSEIARKNKHFKKRQHLLNDDPAYLYDDDSEDMEENLIKKSEFTEVTPERFAAWMIAFRAEQKIKQDRDPVFQRKKMMLAKPSGRDIFSDKTKDFVTYYDDEKNEDDDEAVDLKREKDEMVDEDDLEIDEDVFDDEDDLDDEDFIDDEEN